MKKFKRWSGVILKKNDKVLMCKRAPNKSLPNIWSIPSGHVEDGETPGQAAIREYFEETHIKLPTDIQLVGFVNKYNDDETIKRGMMYVFYCETDENIEPDLEKASDGFEHTECKFFSYEELPEQKKNKDLMEIIKKIFN